jgi:hypothetical protein
MSTEREWLKSRIRAQVEVLVEQALAQGEKRLTLSQIEELALAARSGIAQELTSGLLAQHTSRAASCSTCPNCGQRMQPKGKKQRYLYVSVAAMSCCNVPTSTVLSVARDIFPLDEEVELHYDTHLRQRTEINYPHGR